MNYTPHQVDWCLSLTPSQASPIVISVPHDGLPRTDFEGIFNARVTGHHFRDMYVWNVVVDILRHHPVHGIRGLLPRKFVDYNRSWPHAINYYPATQAEAHTALDDLRLVSSWGKYHETIAATLASQVARFSQERALLLDFHGFIRQPDYAPPEGFDLILGTGNRVTIPFGDPDVRIARFMESCGYRVFLPEQETRGRIEDLYSADFTTRHHSATSGINAIQIEIANRFRTRHGRAEGIKLAHDFVRCFVSL